jgi:hypothetical protein
LRFVVNIILFFESFQIILSTLCFYSRAEDMNTKIGLGIAVASVVIAVAMLAPLATSADAARAQVCQSGPTAGTGPCPGNSGSNGNCNRMEDTKAGKGQGSGEIKDTTC